MSLMNAIEEAADIPGEGSPRPAGRDRVLTLVFTDLVNSLALKRRLGDAAAGHLMARHWSLVRTILFETGGREISGIGDGFFLTFETPTAAVEFALYLQKAHAEAPELPPLRIGIHMGEVTERENPPSAAERIQIEGLAVDLCSRIQNLALPRQTLLSYPVFDNARQRLHNGQLNLPVTWRAHGRYYFKGVETSLDMYEAGLEGMAPLVPPTDTDKARREVSSDEESTLGWRPAQNQEFPGRPNWILSEKLGEGGFGDVWLVEHSKTRERRVIKFCYSSQRLSALKREVTLFRLLKESFGERDDISRVLDYQFDQPPFYLEMEYAGQLNLKDWLERKDLGGATSKEDRLELVAQVAEALSAAHSIGILHKDIKPSNILVAATGSKTWQARVIDFGIGGIADRDLLAQKGITATGLTENLSSLTGTALYMAPEVLEGRPASTQSDLYSLGVVLYQVVTRDSSRALAPGWERDVEDELLRQDIASCVDGNPQRRLASTRELAERLRSLPRRREEANAASEREAAVQRRRRRRPLYWLAAGAALLTLILGGLFTWELKINMEHERRLRELAVTAKRDALRHAEAASAASAAAEQARYYSLIQVAASAISDHRIEKARRTLLQDVPVARRNLEWGWLYAQTSQESLALRGVNAYDAVFSPSGQTFATGDRDTKTSGTGWVTIYDAQTGKRLRGAQVHKALIWDLRYSPDGKYIVTAASDWSAAIVNAETLETVHQLKGHTQIVRAAAFSPDSRFVATCARDSTIRIWDANTGSEVRKISVPGERFADLQFSKSGTTMVSTSLEGQVRQWDVASGSELAAYPGHNDSVLAAAFAPSGQVLITSCKDGLVRFFPYSEDGTTSGAVALHSISVPGTFPAALDVATSSTVLGVACDDGSGLLYDIPTGNQLLRFQSDEPGWKIHLSADAKRALMTTRWSVRMFDIPLLTHPVQFSSYTGDPLSSSVAKIRVPSIIYERDTTWNLDRDWKTTSGRTLLSYEGSKIAADSFYSVFSPDDTRCVRIHDKTLSTTVLEVPSARRLAELNDEPTCDATFSPNGKMLVLAGMKSRARIYETTTWKQVHLLDRGESECSRVLFSHDGGTVAVGYGDGSILVWDASTGKRLTFLQGGGYRVLAMEWSPDGGRLVTGHASDNAKVWDVNSGKLVSTLMGHVRYVHYVTFSPDGSRVLTAARDNSVKLWDTQSGQELATIFSFTGNRQAVAAFFQPGTRHIGALTSDRQVLLSDYFPSDPVEYREPGLTEDDQIELWKRRTRLNANIAPVDLAKR